MLQNVESSFSSPSSSPTTTILHSTGPPPPPPSAEPNNLLLVSVKVAHDPIFRGSIQTVVSYKENQVNHFMGLR